MERTRFRSWEKQSGFLTGFTLIELLVVIGIIMILAGLILPNMMGITAAAKEAKSKTEISGFVQALTMYEADNGAYPAHDAAFSSLPLIVALKGDSSATPPKKRYFTFKPNRIKSDGYYSALDFPYYYREIPAKPDTN
ncbi:MAG: type II secretion system protein GspG, partial [Planctomycetota bacterium]